MPALLPLRRFGLLLSLGVALGTLVAPLPVASAGNPLVVCQKAIDQAGASLLQKALKIQQECLEAQDVGKLPVGVSCVLDGGSVVGVSDGKARSAILAASVKMRTAVQRKCAGIDFFATAPDGLGYPSRCAGIGGACAAFLFSAEDLLECLSCTHLAAARYVVGLERPGLGQSGASTTPVRTTTPTPTPTPPDACPVAVEMIGTAGTQGVLDTGWTGLAHNQTVIQDGKLTFSLSGCGSSTRPCGVCNVGGPIQNAHADAGDINAHRCTNDTSIKCTDDSGCTSPGKCAFFFGAPLPLSAGGISTCVTNQVNGSVHGTVNVETGAFASTLNLSSRVFNAIQLALPCPVCVGDATVNDGTKGGTCNGGPKNGAPCDGNGRSAVPSFGTTSFDCPPNPGALITTLSIALDGSSGTETLTLASTSPPCSTAPGKKCFCPADGQVTQPNACLDDTSTPNVDESLCAADSQTKGHCPTAPIDTICAIENFRGCLADSDCPASGDHCTTQNRPCYLDNGAVGGSVTANGMADPPDASGASDPTFAALFCVGKTNAALNAAAGLPGLGRIELPLHTKQLLTLP